MGMTSRRASPNNNNSILHPTTPNPTAVGSGNAINNNIKNHNTHHQYPSLNSRSSGNSNMPVIFQRFVTTLCFLVVCCLVLVSVANGASDNSNDETPISSHRLFSADQNNHGNKKRLRSLKMTQQQQQQQARVKMAALPDMASASSSSAASNELMGAEEDHAESEGGGMAAPHTFSTSSDGKNNKNPQGMIVADTWAKAMKNLQNEDNKAEQQKRMLIHEGHARMEVALGDLEEKIVPAVHRIMTETNGAFIEEEASYKVMMDDYMYQQRHQGYYENDSDTNNKNKMPTPKGMRWRIRVPSDTFSDTLQRFREAAGGSEHVVDWSTTSRDVTDQYVDATSRASVVDASRQSLQVLLRGATSVKQIFEIEKELTRLTQQYESHRQRAQVLAKDSSLSTIYLDIFERAVDASRPRPPRGPQLALWKGAQEAVNELSSMFILFANELVFWIVFLIPLAVLVMISWYLLPWLCQCLFPGVTKHWARARQQTTNWAATMMMADGTSAHPTTTEGHKE